MHQCLINLLLYTPSHISSCNTLAMHQRDTEVSQTRRGRPPRSTSRTHRHPPRTPECHSSCSARRSYTSSDRYLIITSRNNLGPLRPILQKTVKRLSNRSLVRRSPVQIALLGLSKKRSYDLTLSEGVMSQK